MKRGEIWWSDAGEPSGSEPGYRRPALIVSANSFNSTPINTVLVAFLTTNASRVIDPGNLWLTSKQSGLPSGSVVNITQLGAVDKRILSDRIGRLSDHVMKEIDEGLRLVLDLAQ